MFSGSCLNVLSFQKWTFFHAASQVCSSTEKSFIMSCSYNMQMQAEPAVFLDKNTKVICQGMTGKNGTFHTEQVFITTLS